MGYNLLQGKTVAITGAATGIGRSIAVKMADEGANVVINHFPSEEQAQLAKELGKEIGEDKFLAVPGDISKPETGKDLVAKTVEKFGELNVFVSNAGICPFAEFTEMPAETYLKTVEINLNGAFFSTQAAAKQMKLQGKGGSIIGVSSISALVGGGFQTHYTPTKAGILSLMQSEAVALGEYGIRCNALLPGTIRTGLNEEDLANDEKRVAMEKRVPLQRLGVPDDLAGPAVFLASDMSQYVTGAQVLVDGGLFVNLQ
ncbi:L-rhamnose-1-dehydrogenase [Komagataella phaffii CBS 7435]|uniref:Peroxisomal 2,4-dienoyl-CoA reductase, auxiliary enzyme of fatty acid beta-oxidation n=2 Tax=Komagataella phaffii TaxID=460519 RepID=C4R7K6_KOMPG|nr:Peroxisomal 2,4-dienoyl-CoA reductase, auxiliary enzyme of fatty acid beta-oxidation [Komagataella phaffii GS115]AOA65065.1 GQ67_04678T0 [Komagataella phaffii]CAH2451043.1 L-rhamnose-1-dehydrogenase [Komagataella phaffii CBS 7435]AOA70425.1 GQ68_04650T0 [Komagataella phaffii GS115]CAY71581.1 Peroxisomal 2,4-dienoyl-CoA reductase, auxiliary enzyme of fatty acid beta-oxidation [Komagataella phaffii GS115]CCA40814.1 L-rhamnose-1-dehydrogenase [Komagataella phaffii CBS 7435]